MANLSHIMPKPFVVPILWGHDYVENPTTVQNISKMVSDLVTGPFMNGMAQYGVQRGSVHEPILIDDQNPPEYIVYYDSNNNYQDSISYYLEKWVEAELVPPPTNDYNQSYLIIPPIESKLQTYNGKNDPKGLGVQGFHNFGVSVNFGPIPCYWAIVKTEDAGPISSPDFVAGSTGLAPKVCHELAEEFVDRNGTYPTGEVGDGCVSNQFKYRGWAVQQYTSVWDGKTCINGDNPVSVQKFLNAIGFNTKNQGPRALGTPVINVDYIALTMQSYDT